VSDIPSHFERVRIRPVPDSIHSRVSAEKHVWISQIRAFRI
jgi:hypothetical protein